MSLDSEGWVQFPPTQESLRWAEAALQDARRVTTDPELRKLHLRHKDTWFVGVDALDNDIQGGVGGVPLTGPWEAVVPGGLPLHRAQLSVIYPGYPQQDAGQSDANHRFRVDRSAAHVDGLLPEGPRKRRFAREFHAYVLGIHLNDVKAAPTVVWPGSHIRMGAALRAAIGDQDIGGVDLTDVYQATRREIFDEIAPVPLSGPVGGSFVLHRFALHGTAPWTGSKVSEGRMTAFFRPEFGTPDRWLAPN